MFGTDTDTDTDTDTEPIAPPPQEPAFQPGADTLTPRAFTCAILLGSAINLANLYFGLQAGTVNAMPMQSALLGYVIFRNLQHRLTKNLSPSETTVIEIVAGSLGLAPFTSGFTGFIPALEFIATPAENGPIALSICQLLLWALATCALGILLAAPFRRLFILRERLLYPSATATGTLIGVLFRDETIVSRAKQPRTAVCPTIDSDNWSQSLPIYDRPSRDSPSEIFPSFDHDEIRAAIHILLLSLGNSLSFSLISYFIPVLRNVPIFGSDIAKNWLWALDLSPAYFGYGMIIGPTICLYSLLGAIIGWGCLSPIATHHGWASGSVDDFDAGPRGWILWVGMGLTLGDSLAGLGWASTKPLITFARYMLKQGHSQPGENAPLLSPLRFTGSTQDDAWPTTSLTTSRMLICTGLVLVSLYLSSMMVVFQDFVTVRATMAALLLMPLGGFISMRALGETDNGGSLAIARLAQFVLRFTVPASNKTHMSANLLLGGAVEAAASQSSQHMGALKTAYMTKTAPRVVFYSQILGSLIGALVATLTYRLYTSVNAISSRDFGIPDAHMWLVAAKLMYQQGLPPRALEFTSAAFFLGVCFGMIRIAGRDCWWRDYAPSGVAIAIGMYIVPSITLPRAIGSVGLVICTSKLGVKQFITVSCATGLILGQGLFSVVALIFDGLKVSRL